jgi:iron complex outermembrane receptor protein
MPPLLLLFALIAVWAAPVGAQPVPADSLEERVLPDVTVTAARTPVPIAEAAARVRLLEATDADAAGATSIADLLEKRSAVFVKRYGPSGLATLALGGSEAKQAVVLLDGQRIADPQLGQLDVGLLPAILFERVEVVQGPASALYGTDAVGGVVHLRTETAGRSLRVRTEAGAFGERSVALAARDEVEIGGGRRLSALVAAQHAQADGDYRYFDPTHFDNEAGQVGVWVRREGADTGQTSLLTRVRLREGARSVSAGIWGARAERGIVSLSAQPARQWDDHLRVWSDVTARLGRVRVTALGAFQQRGLRYESRSVRDDGTTKLWTGEARASLPLPTRLPVRGVWTLTAGTALSHARADHPALVDGTGAVSTVALFASADADYGRVRLFPALRVDRTTFGGAVSPSLGVNVQPLPWKPLRLKARIADAFRAPTINDCCWGEGTPGIRPEHGWTAEAGAALRLGSETARLDVSATVLQRALRNRIVWSPDPDRAGDWYPENVGRVETVGYEVALDAAVGRRGRLRAEAGGLVSAQRARDRSDAEPDTYGQGLLYTPDLQAKAYAALEVGPLWLDAGLQHAGRRLITRGANAQSLPPYAVMGAGARLRLPMPRGARLTLGARLENVTDHAYQVITGYPMPPRHLRFSLSLTSF